MAKKVPGQPSAAAISAVVENAAPQGAFNPLRPLPKLRELGQARLILDGWLAETEGEETPELADLFQQLEGETHEKVEKWGLYLLDRQQQAALMKAEEEFYQAEADRLAERRKSYEAGTERSMAQLQFQLELQGIEKVEGTYCTVALQQNPPKVIGEVSPETLAEWFQCEDQVLNSFVRYRPESFELDRNAVKTAAKNFLIAQLPAGLEVKADKRVVVK